MAEDLTLLSDDELEARLLSLVAQERERTIEVIALLAEFHRRHLATRRGYSGLFYYCTRKLGYSADQAMRRITVARLSVRCPDLIPKLQAREISVSAVRLLSPIMTPENHQELLQKASGRPFSEVERLAASLGAAVEKRDHVQTVQPRPEDSQSDALDDLPLFAAAATSTPLVSDFRVHFGFTGSEELRQKLDRAKAVLWHKFPDGRLEDIFGQAIEDLLDRRDPERQPEPRRKLSKDELDRHLRYIPRWVRAQVWKRDGGRCAYTTDDGVRCGEVSGLEYDHLVPYALGGPSDEPSNIRLLCRAHNQLLARERFGERPQARAT